MRQPTLKQLRYLCAVAEHQHFGHAASACHVSQSTLSAGILELEESLGISLVERNNRKVFLTSLGEEVVGRADDYAAKQWEEVEEVVKYRLAKGAIVLCHNCYVEQERKLTAMVDRNYDRWMESPASYVARIRTIAETYKYYKFEGELGPRIKSLVEALKGSTNDR